MEKMEKIDTVEKIDAEQDSVRIYNIDNYSELNCDTIFLEKPVVIKKNNEKLFFSRLKTDIFIETPVLNCLTSFYEHNRNYLKNTYDKKLPTKDANISPISYSKGGNCNVCENVRQVHTKYSNKQFYKNAAVSSSTRLEKLK